MKHIYWFHHHFAFAEITHPSGKGRTRQWVIDDSLKMLDKVIGDRFGLIPPISFYGESHTEENAHERFGVVVDVVYVGKQQLKNLLKQFGNGVQLRPLSSCSTEWQ